MECCPSCGSRWVRRRRVPWFARFLKGLTTRRPYFCPSCRWRGWRPSSPSADVHVEPPPESRPREQTRPTNRFDQLRPFDAHLRVIGWSAVFALGIAFGAVAVWILNEPALRIRSEAVASATTSATTGTGAPAQPSSFAEPEGMVGRLPTIASPEPSASGERRKPRPTVAPRRVAAPVNERAAARPNHRKTQRSTDVAAARPAAAPGPSFGALRVDSVPRGARVSLNGRPIGSTPMVLRDVRAGTHLVRLEADGYQVWAWTARVVAHQQRTLTVTLVAVPRSVLATSEKAVK